MAGRPSLRIGTHGKITRIRQGNGVWLARCRYRDSDGVTRVVQKLGPPSDPHGRFAEDALLEALTARRPPSGGVDEVSLDSAVMTLVHAHIARLEQDGRSLQTLQAYRYDAAMLDKFMARVKVGEASPARLDAVLRSVRDKHGAVRARRVRTLLRGGLALAVLAGALGTNPVRDVSAIRSKSQPKGATALTADQLRDLLGKLGESKYCQDRDLVDPITMVVATGLRRSELLGLRWSDFNETAGTIAVTGKVVRVVGKGLIRLDETKTAAGRRTIPLPRFAIDMLRKRRGLPYLGEHKVVIFPSTAGTLRDPDNFAKQWRSVRDELGVPDVRGHSFRKSVATLIDDDGMSARVGADHLGHAKVSMTQDRYMSRGKVHSEVADLLDRTVGA